MIASRDFFLNDEEGVPRFFWILFTVVNLAFGLIGTSCVFDW